MRLREIFNEARLRTDVPDEDWLERQIDYAKSKGRNRFGVPFMKSVTAYIREGVTLPVKLLASLPGARGEQNNVRHKDLEAIVSIMKDTGKLPIVDGYEYKPFITVAYDGSAWVNEGNHRIMAAEKLGWNELPVELRYFDGGERIKSGALYPSKIGLNEGKSPHKKGTKKYKTHMAAKHAAMNEDREAGAFFGVPAKVRKIMFRRRYTELARLAHKEYHDDDNAVSQRTLHNYIWHVARRNNVNYRALLVTYKQLYKDEYNKKFPRNQ